MKKENYLDVINHIPLGYACHHRIIDDNSEEIQYEVIEANKEFEAIMGRSFDKLLGRDSSTIMADSANNRISSRDIHYATHFYNRKVEVEIYSTAQKGWYNVEFFRVKDDYIVSILKEALIDNNKKQHYLNENQCVNYNNILIDTIMNALFEKNPREMLHSKRVGSICEAIAINMKDDNLNIDEVRNAGLLHDVGKIAVNNEILDKRGKLTQEEWSQIKTHCEKGYRILCGSLIFSRIARFIYEHHERLNGSGYPRGLRKAEISMGARIIAVADTFDAMISERPYRKAFSEGEALEELHKYSGNHFDSKVVDAMTDIILKKIWKRTDMV